LITSFSLQNFRSIYNTDITLPLSGICAFIGANGSGKSNAVKALDFISTMHATGLNSAIIKGGLREGLAPKSLSINEIHDQPTRISYEIRLPPPLTSNSPDMKLAVRHELTLRWTGPRRYKILSENLYFSDALRLSRILDSKSAGPVNISHSSIKLTREHQQQVLEVVCEPPLDDSNIKDYARWIGGWFKQFAEENKLTTEALQALWSKIHFDQESRGQLSQSLIDQNQVGTLILRSPQFNKFRAICKSIKRFDMLMSELRSEQESLDDSSLTSVGKHLPAAWRNIKKSNNQSYDEIIRTLRQIAPHISDTRVRQLATGNEYVAFNEIAGRRPVESWNSSDGTLRALAIMVAVESAGKNGIIVIEEPEQNLHPWAIPPLIRHIKSAIQRGSCSQVILTTHSAEVIESMEPGEVYIASRDPKSGTTIIPCLDLVYNQNITSLELARMWSQGQIGAVPTDIT
jgi:predicted ATPase